MNEKRGMHQWLPKTLACGWMVLASLTAQADEFAVGRVDVEFAEEGWKEIALPDTSQAYGGEKNGALAVEEKLYVRELPATDGQVLVIVGTNSTGLGGGRGGYMSYSPNCKSDDQNHREGNEGFRATFAQCLTVTPLYHGESVYKALAPQLMTTPVSDAVSVQRPVYTVWNRHAISTGSFVDVRVFVTSPLDADSASVTDPLPQGVPPALVAWGRQLKDAVKSSVYSLSGHLKMPPIRLAVPAATAPAAETPGG